MSLVADPLTLPIRQRRMQHTYSYRSDTLLVACLHGSPAQANCIGGVVEAAQPGMRRHGHAFPHDAWPERADNRRCPADVIGIAVRDRKSLEMPHTEREECGGNDSSTDVEVSRIRLWRLRRLRGRDASCVDEHGLPSRQEDGGRVP